MIITCEENTSFEGDLRRHGLLDCPHQSLRSTSAALQASSSIGTARIVTTDAVLTEYLNALAAKGENLRQAAIESVEIILANPAVTVVGNTRKAFLDGFALYKDRPDKGYSLTDCFSMMLMRKRKIAQVLTTDRHFEQEGFMLIMATSVRRKSSAMRKG